MNVDKKRMMGIVKSVIAGAKVAMLLNVGVKRFLLEILPHNITEEEFKNFFGEFGTVQDAVVMHDRVTGRPRGFGFITYESEDSVDNILQKRFHKLNDQDVEVKMAEPKDNNNKSIFTYTCYNNGLSYEEGSLPPYTYGGDHCVVPSNFSPYLPWVPASALGFYGNYFIGGQGSVPPEYLAYNPYLKAEAHMNGPVNWYLFDSASSSHGSYSSIVDGTLDATNSAQLDDPSNLEHNGVENQKDADGRPMNAGDGTDVDIKLLDETNSAHVDDLSSVGHNHGQSMNVDDGADVDIKTSDATNSVEVGDLSSMECNNAEKLMDGDGQSRNVDDGINYYVTALDIANSAQVDDPSCFGYKGEEHQKDVDGQPMSSCSC